MSVYHNIYANSYDEKTKQVLNEVQETDFMLSFNYLSTVISTFKWGGDLPEDCRQHIPEENLCYWGLQGLFKDDDGNFRIYPCYGVGKLLENGLYDTYCFIARNGKMWYRKLEDICLCFNNFLRIPSFGIINEYAEKSKRALNAVDAALERAMIPPIVTGRNESQMKQIGEYINNEPMNRKPFRTAQSDDFKAGEIEVHKFFDNRENDILSLWDVYVRYRNLFYTTFGINNIEIQKRERLTQAEGSGNDEITRYTLLSDMYECRKNFVDLAKEKFGINITIELNRDSTTVYQILSDNEEKIKNALIEISKGSNVAQNNNGGEGNADSNNGD